MTVLNEREAIEVVRQAYRQLADVVGEPYKHHVLVSIYRMGQDCSKCGGAWDGFWGSENEDRRLCHACGDAVLREVMGDD